MTGLEMLSFLKRKQETEQEEYPLYPSVSAAVKAMAIGSVLASNSLSTGLIKCTTGVKIDGRHFGDVVVDGSDMAVCWISPAATIRGQICAPVVYVEGAVHGDIFADRVIVMRGGVVDGDIYAVETMVQPNSTPRGRTFKSASREYRGVGADITKKMIG